MSDATQVPTRPARRRFIAGGTAMAAACLATRSARGRTPATFDLLVRGGNLVDPALGIQARADLGVRAGRITAIDTDIPADTATRVVDASGCIVAPGLVDMHTRVYPKRPSGEMPAEALAGVTGVTAWVSVGDVGVDDLADFRSFRARHTRCRVYAFVAFDRRQLHLGAQSRVALADALGEHRDGVLGLDVRVTDTRRDLTLVRQAIEVLQLAQTRGRIVCHAEDPSGVDELLELLRPGDMLAQAYRGANSGLLETGRLRPAVSSARQRGVVIDAGSSVGIDPAVARDALARGLLPDVISSGWNGDGGPKRARPDLTAAMNTCLALGLSIEQVLAMTTANPARLIGRDAHLGTLALGAPADLAVLRTTTQAGTPASARLECVLATRSGVILPR